MKKNPTQSILCVHAGCIFHLSNQCVQVVKDLIDELSIFKRTFFKNLKLLMVKLDCAKLVIGLQNLLLQQSWPCGFTNGLEFDFEHE